MHAIITLPSRPPSCRPSLVPSSALPDSPGHVFATQTCRSMRPTRLIDELATNDQRGGEVRHFRCFERAGRPVLFSPTQRSEHVHKQKPRAMPQNPLELTPPRRLAG
ncbi:hypothetical protein BC567DRAFT_228342 [Phyllosticta citribraziliensis]